MRGTLQSSKLTIIFFKKQWFGARNGTSVTMTGAHNLCDNGGGAFRVREAEDPEPQKGIETNRQNHFPTADLTINLTIKPTILKKQWWFGGRNDTSVTMPADLTIKCLLILLSNHLCDNAGGAFRVSETEDPEPQEHHHTKKGRRFPATPEMCSGSEAGSYLRLIDFCITQL